MLLIFRCQNRELSAEVTLLDERRQSCLTADSCTTPASRQVYDMYWTLDACDAFGQRWIVHHDYLLGAVVLLGEMLGVDWEDG